MAVIPGHVYDKYLRDENIQSTSEGDVILVATNKEFMYFIENLHIKASAKIKTLKFSLGRLKIVSFKAGKELY